MKVFIFAAVLLLVGVASSYSVQPEKRDLEGLYKQLMVVMEKIHEYVMKIMNDVADKIPEIKEKLNAAVTKLKEKIQELKEKGKEHFANVQKDIQGAISDLLDLVNRGLAKNIGPLTNFNLSIIKKMLEVAQEGLNHLGN